MMKDLMIKIKSNPKRENILVLLGAMLAIAALLVAPAVADTYLIESTDKDEVHYYEYFDYIEENATTPSHSQNGGYSSSGYDKSMAYNGVDLELDIFDATPSSHEHDGIVFTPWTDTTSLPRSAGSYYLTDDVELDYGWSTPDGYTNLCLNGHSVTTNYDERAVFVISVRENSSLNLYDSSVARTGKIAGGKEVKHDDNSTDSGGGVWLRGNFTMYGGAISDNLGDGVLVSPSGTFVMVDGIISNNTATHTAGVGIGGTFIMMGGIISDNVAELGTGGVVTSHYTVNHRDGSSSLYTGSFVMLGGTITRNSANKSSSAGGVRIQGTSNSSDGRMFPAGEFILGGGVVTGNFAAGIPSNVYLAKDVTITCIQESEIEAGTNIGVTTQIKPYVNNPVAITGQNVGDYSQYFFADNAKYRIENRENVLYLVSNEVGPVPPSPPPAPTPTPSHGIPHTLLLKPGWNFISVPVVLASSCDTAGELFATVNTDGFSPLGYDPVNGWNTLTLDTKIQPLNGYWIYSADSSAIYLDYSKSVTTPPSKSLSPGWNAVGLCAAEQMDAQSVFHGLSWNRYVPWSVEAGTWGRTIVNDSSDVNSPENMVSLGDGGWLYLNAAGTYVGNAATPVKITYVVGIDAEFYPFTYIDVYGNSTGFDVESIQWIAEHMGFNVIIQPLAWDGIISTLENGKIDMIYSGMSITPDRANRVDFSIPYWTARPSVAVRSGSSITMDMFNAGAVTIGVQKECSGNEWLIQHFGANYSEMLGTSIFIYDSFIESMTALEQGIVDTVIFDDAGINHYISENPNFAKLGMTDGVENFAVAVRKGDAQLLALINEGLTDLMASEKWTELKNKYELI